MLNVLANIWPGLALVALIVAVRYLTRPGPVVHLTKNPLHRQRNMRCPCGSGSKAKRCCGLYSHLPISVARNVDRLFKAMGLTRRQRRNRA